MFRYQKWAAIFFMIPIVVVLSAATGAFMLAMYKLFLVSPWPVVGALVVIAWFTSAIYYFSSRP